MKFNEIGKTGMVVSALSFGASSLGSVFRSTREEEALDAVYTAIEGGMNFIDVSPYYGHYKAETVLGKALRNVPRDKYYLSTKVGRYGKDGVNTWDYSAKRAQESVYESMERLGIDHIDLINVHDVEFADLNQVVNEPLPALVELREKGIVSHVGITDLQLENIKWVIEHVPAGTVESVLNFCHYCLCDDKIVDFLDFFEENNTAYIVMEYVKGTDLRHYIRMQNRALTVREILPVMRPILFALHKVHQADLVHRDISPDNIMILPDGTAKLLDFGAAREVDHAEAGKELPQSTEAILKHGFAPIEQYSRRGSLGPWTDVYALCATMYYCLTGRIPNAATERLMGDDNVDWRSIPGLTEQQITALEKGMALRLEERFQSMEELYHALYTQQQAAPKPASSAQKQSAPKAEHQKQAPKQTVAVQPKKKKKTGLLTAAALFGAACTALTLSRLRKDK